MKRFVILISLLLSISTHAFAQGDDVIYNETNKTLSYFVDYDRLAANAEAKDCSAASFENGLVHAALRHMFLFLPFEATYHDGVEFIDINVIKDEELVLYSRASLEAIRTTNKRFRVFMNSFASPRAGFCFAINENTLELWLNTLTAREGLLAFDPGFFNVTIPGAIDIAGISELRPAVLSQSSQNSSTTATDTKTADANVDTNVREAVQEPISSTASETVEGPAPEPQAALPESPEAVAAPGTSNIFEEVPFISSLPVRTFAGEQLILDPRKDYAAIIDTTKGQLFVDLFEDLAPNTVNNFIFLSLNRFYEGLSFYRVLEDFMAQTGDPTGSGNGGPGYQIADEIVEGFSHSSPGILSMANAGPNTAGSQFFITFAPAPWLDGQHSIFGAALDGVEILEALQLNDPGVPLALATPDTTLGLLEFQGIRFNGADNFTFDRYLIETFGFIPPNDQRLSLESYDFILTVDPQTENRLVAFWPRSDKINSITIIERDKP